MPFNNNLPNVQVTELEIGGGDLVAATFCRGVWFSDLAEECNANSFVTGQLEGNHHNEVSNPITSTAEIYHEVGTNVVLKAGSRIFLTPGFHARRLTKIKALIGPCR